MPPVIILLKGAQGVGKSTAGAHLREKHHFTEVSFAGPLRTLSHAIVKATYDLPNLPQCTFESPEYKDKPLCRYSAPLSIDGFDLTPRRAMIFLGEKIRDMFGVDFWAIQAANSIRREVARKSSMYLRAKIVITDLRRANELAFIRAAFPEAHIRVWHLIGRHSSGYAERSSAAPERDMRYIAAHTRIQNIGSIQSFQDVISLQVAALHRKLNRFAVLPPGH